MTPQLQTHSATPSRPGEPTWEIVELFPRQGQWSAQAYLALESNRLVEFKHGCLELLPMPSKLHQQLVAMFYEWLKEYVRARNLDWAVYFAPMPVRLDAQTFREPDVVVEAGAPASEGSDNHVEANAVKLAVEVVSPSNRAHDLTTKRAEYAQAGIPEYWIVEPDPPHVEVLVLDKPTNTYTHHGSFRPGDTATSATLTGFALPVDALRNPLEARP